MDSCQDFAQVKTRDHSLQLANSTQIDLLVSLWLVKTPLYAHFVQGDIDPAGLVANHHEFTSESKKSVGSLVEMGGNMAMLNQILDNTAPTP